VGPAGPEEARVIVNVAGWLVVELSLLSNVTPTTPSFGVMIKPLLVVPFSQL
jgi:hypothetical protein